jgi:glycosyltransferase involved in cell wall biosynthesis
MSLGVPVLSAGCGGKLLRDGVDAVVVADDDPVSMSQAALGLLKDPALRLRLGREARNRFLSSMSWEVVAPAIEAVYEKTLAAGPVSVGAEAVNM